VHVHQRFFLSVANGNCYRDLLIDDVLEMTHTVDSGVLRRLPGAIAPPAINSVVKAYLCYQRMATLAIVGSRPELLSSALSIHPWITDVRVARQISADIVAASNDFSARNDVNQVEAVHDAQPR
jgi:alpha-galactosidase/6-phospho-beta-glucosidase family protein